MDSTEIKAQIEQENKGNAKALLPIAVFLLFFLGSGVIAKDFYAMPTIVAFLIALAVAFCQNPRLKFNDKIKVCTKGIGDENVVMMCFIFLTAGAFSGAVTAAGGADSTVYLGLSLIPSQFAVGVSNATSFAMPLCLSAVVSGAMFGDNLSMISDTTIAAVRTQGCEMSDKFKMNFKIVLPAAILTAVIYFLLTMHGSSTLELGTYNIWQVIPYLLVLIGALMGINVFVVLIFGTIASVIAGVTTGTMPVNEIFTSIGAGVSSMYDITVISITVAAIGALVKEYGGIDAVLHFIHRNTKGKKGAQLSIAALVAGVDLATANNTIAIVMAGPIAREISQEFDIDPRRTASLLDIFASVAQGLIPYGAQMLYAAAAAGITTYAIIPYTFYPILMAISAFVFIFGFSQKEKSKKES